MESCKKLNGPDGGNDLFGYNVDISDNYVIIGAIHHDFNGILNSGAAYIYKNSNDSWTQTAKLTCDVPIQNDNFGNSVTLTDDYAAVGMAGADIESESNGKVFLFKRSDESWNHIQTMLPPVNKKYGNFGRIMSMSGDTLAIGFSMQDSLFSVQSGAVYVYKMLGNNCPHISTYYPKPQYSIRTGFGYALDLNDDYFIASVNLSEFGLRQAAYIGYVSTPQINVSYDNYSNLPIDLSVYTESGGDVTLSIES
ncbi:MAG: hypothetical protein OMM_12461, partial [Candidatus Magnetoglobus multicellularis str. Araruama]